MTSRSGVQITLLGTGTSTGIPIIGCDCEVCTSVDPRDRRTRCSALVQSDGLSILIDAGPDFRAQALRERIGGLDAVLFTHHHFDHVVGLDDLRPFLFRNRRAIPCFADATTAPVLRRSFSYIFDDGSYPGVPNLTLNEFAGPFSVQSRAGDSASVKVTPVPLLHGDLPVTGYRIGNLAYLTDVSTIPQASFDLLSGVDVLVIDALRRRPHPTHFSVDEALEAATRIGARETRLIHLTHSMLHAREDALMPTGVRLGYDGERLTARGA
jgi:phosphoribosyl 1,2-cyclic phosphate phosphodiesterase